MLKNCRFLLLAFVRAQNRNNISGQHKYKKQKHYIVHRNQTTTEADIVMAEVEYGIISTQLNITELIKVMMEQHREEWKQQLERGNDTTEITTGPWSGLHYMLLALLWP